MKDGNARYALLAAGWALATVAILIVAKAYAWYVSGSAAVLATLIDSVNDAAISLLMLLALRFSLKPADADHRYGHGKAEGLAALFQSAFLAGSGFFLFLEGAQQLAMPDRGAAAPQNPAGLETGMIVAGLSMALSLLLVAVQRFCLARAPSLLIEADSAHYRSDILLNGAVILALAIAYKGGPGWVEPLTAVLIAGYFIGLAVTIARKAADMLMDRELPQAVRQRIEEIVLSHDDVHGLHDLRTRKSGMKIHISFDVEIDENYSLARAHEVTRQLERQILADYPHAEIIIHKDPLGDTYDARHLVKGLHV